MDCMVDLVERLRRWRTDAAEMASGNPNFAKDLDDAIAALSTRAGERERVIEYEAPRNPNEVLRVRGVFRDAGEPRSLGVALTERPTDDEIRSLHDYLREWRFDASPTTVGGGDHDKLLNDGEKGWP